MPLTVMNIVLADDDEDDRLLFDEAISEIDVKTKLSLFNDGKALMDYLVLPDTILPEIVFLDLNMPIKNGMQCLKEIRANDKLKELCVAIYLHLHLKKILKTPLLMVLMYTLINQTVFLRLKKP
ncbi:two-component response regulator CheY subfamily [Algibacter lectus]|uniref:Two-component response regulator CheY subfamily n=1 Tax=Algibacter lectus TaxID=221126 RepID=A0A090X5Z7_9FLAO|nr:two-component response regulator CheY subfamily [Algibacter lectus]